MFCGLSVVTCGISRSPVLILDMSIQIPERQVVKVLPLDLVLLSL